MAHLNQQWKERVEAVQQELVDIKDETAAIHRQREQLKIERNTFASNSKAEKIKCQEDMKQLESSASVTSESLAAAASKKAEAERILAAANSVYQLDLVHLMNEVKHAEQLLASREIPAEALERESTLWVAEEEALRERMRAIEKDIVEARKAGSAAVAMATEGARNAEAELHAARMERNADEGTGAFVFSDAVAGQYPELLVLDSGMGDDTRMVRKGRSASGRSNVCNGNNNNNNNNNNSSRAGPGSRKGGSLVGNNAVQSLQQRRVNIVDEDAS